MGATIYRIIVNLFKNEIFIFHGEVISLPKEKKFEISKKELQWNIFHYGVIYIL